MSDIQAIDMSSRVIDIFDDRSAGTREQSVGPPQRIDGYTMGVVTMEHDAPHGGEVHPDGDEILYLISGRVRVTGDTSGTLEILPGQACIVPRGEWHRVSILEKSQLVYITPGPHGDHRPI